MRPLVLLLFLITVPLAAQQSDFEAQDEQNNQNGEQPPEEAAPPPGPSISEQNGVIVIRSSTRSAPPAQPTEPAESDESAESDEADPAETDAAPEAEAAADPATTPAPAAPAAPTPSSKNQRIHVVNLSGNTVEISIVGNETTSATGQQKTLTLKSISKRDVPYLSEREEILSQTDTEKIVERTAQRYDAGGNPTQQEIVREKVQTLPDGTILTTATTFVENINGRLEEVERTVSREKKSGDRIERTTTSERPSINGGFQIHSREESVETRQGDASARIETVRKVNKGGGRLVESGREEAVMSQSGNTATTEKTVWERDSMSSKMVQASKSFGTLVTQADGSSTETVDTYSHSLGDGSGRFLNSTRPELVRTVTRETVIGSAGETIETTHTKSRNPADPSKMAPTRMQQKVRRPGADGETVETHVYEQTVSGRLQPTQTIVEEVQK
jgi:hypothetical protein